MDAPKLLTQIRDLTTFVGDGRKLTQAGYITMADARELVTLLETGDSFTYGIGKVIRSSELNSLMLIVDWAVAAKFVRFENDKKIVTVKNKHKILADDDRLWSTLFEAIPKLGDSFYVAGSAERSVFRQQFANIVKVLLDYVRLAQKPQTVTDLKAVAWQVAAQPYALHRYPTQEQANLRSDSNNCTKKTLGVLARLDAVEFADDIVSLGEQGKRFYRKELGEAEPGDLLYQLKISLENTKVWRRVEVPASMKLANFHQVIQRAMGWESCHLYQFTVGDKRYAPDDEFMEDLVDEDDSKITIGQLALKHQKFRYWYDFGDDWWHTITIEKHLTAEPDIDYPRCTAGKEACPPEDCGGPWGYKGLLQALADPKHPEHQDMMEWLGLDNPSDFNPHTFDPATAL
jgi:hypothetical protein